MVLPLFLLRSPRFLLLQTPSDHLQLIGTKGNLVARREGTSECDLVPTLLSADGRRIPVFTEQVDGESVL